VPHVSRSRIPRSSPERRCRLHQVSPPEEDARNNEWHLQPGLIQPELSAELVKSTLPYLQQGPEVHCLHSREPLASVSTTCLKNSLPQVSLAPVSTISLKNSSPSEPILTRHSSPPPWSRRTSHPEPSSTLAPIACLNLAKTTQFVVATVVSRTSRLTL